MSITSTSWVPAIAGALVGAWLAVPVRADLILHWNFDEASGPVVDDGVSPVADGALFGEAGRITSTPGPGSSRAIDLVGINSGVNNYVGASFASHPTKLDELGQMTVSFWINMQGDPAHIDRVASMWSTGPSSGWELRINNPDTGSIGADNFGLRWFINGLASRPPDILDHGDEWLFLAIAYDSTLPENNTVFYMGTVGEQVGELGAWTPSQSPAPSAAADGTEFRVGSAFASSSDRTPPAWIDDVRVYDEVLDVAQLEQVRLGVAVPEPASILWAVALLSGLGRIRW